MLGLLSRTAGRSPGLLGSVALVAGLAAAELARLLGRQGTAGKQPTYRKSIDKANRKLLECWLEIHLLNLVLENEGH